ncbi:Ig-like domain-containing protein [Chakrabartyella piscis]|uniref:Ig-like domain-containing protein n=1 Tax=Chakrabartyella piscis TaxID=2918914 RepID=UPI0029586FEC|nr:Ig-like domain-containing protein [Chakrabartyella piscis]
MKRTLKSAMTFLLCLTMISNVIPMTALATDGTEITAVEAPVVEESTIEVPAVEAPTEEAIEEEATVEEPAEEATEEEPTVEEPTVEEPTVEEPTIEEPTEEDATVEEPTVEEPTVEEPTIEEPVEEATVEEPVEEVTEEELFEIAEADSVFGDYVQWKSAPVLSEGIVGSFTLSSYSSSFTADQVWFAVNVDADEPVLELSFEDVKYMYCYIYDGTTLASADPSGSNYKTWASFSSDTTYRVQFSEGGMYYFMLRPYNSANTASTPATVSYTAYDNNDSNEYNNSYDTATELTQNVNTYYSLNGYNDVDWFKITTAVSGEGFKMVFSNFDYTVDDIDVTLYSSDGTTVLWDIGDFSADSTYTYKANTPGDYYIKVEADDDLESITKALKIRYEIVDGDENELNDTYDAATKLPESYNMEFNLNGKNDVDWFYFETDTVNTVMNISIKGFDTDYSNKISYYVYSATETGYNTSSLAYKTNVNITHSNSVTCSDIGGYYIRVIPYTTTPVENTLTLCIESNNYDDGGEPNDTWLTATPITEGVAQQYNLPYAEDVDWFVLNVEEANQSVEFEIYIPSGGLATAYLYAGTDLNTSGTSASNLNYEYMYAGTDEDFRYMFSDAGTYYLKLNVRNSGIFTDYGTVTYNLIEPDAQENNNTWKTAATIHEGVAVSYTIPAYNDVDYFEIVTTEPNQTIELTHYVPYGGVIYSHIYSGEDFIDDGDSADYLTYDKYYAGTSTQKYMCADAGSYYVKIQDYNYYVFSEEATLTYTIIEPDAHERNNTWTTATTINEGVTTSYTIPAWNDVDYFKIETTEPNQTIELTHFVPTGGVIWSHIYSGNDFMMDGDSADYLTYDNYYAGTSTQRYMLSDTGTYYIKIQDYNYYIFSENATLTCKFIAPDAHENNNSRDTATELVVQTPMYFTLPATNDYDYIALEDVTVGDSYVFTFGPNTKSYSAYLYYIEEGSVSTTSYGSKTISASTGTFTWTAPITKDGTYYLRLNSSTSSNVVDDERYMKYTITRDDEDVKGVSIDNGEVTIFENKTYTLYANLNPSYATNQNVTWESSNPSVATVDSDGVVTAIKEGSTTITVTTADGGFQTHTTITVVEPILVTGITLTPDIPQPDTDNSEANPKILALSSGIEMLASVVPDNATEQDVLWSVSDPTILSVTTEGKVYAVGSGTAYVTATTTDVNLAEQFSASYWINVPNESYPVKSVSLDLNATTIYMGEAGTQLVASVYPSYADNTNVSWSSENESIATVDQNGWVTPVSAGYVTITVKTEENGFTASCYVSVQPERTRVESISISDGNAELGDTLSLGLYGSTTLSVVTTPTDATDQTVTWSSNNTAVVSVSRTGEVTAIGLGTAVLTATSTDGSFTDTITVQVSLNADYGDVNNDGNVDVADALIVLQANVGLRTLTATQQETADVNDDNYIDAADAILILRYNSGLINSFPVEN